MVSEWYPIPQLQEDDQLDAEGGLGAPAGQFTPFVWHQPPIRNFDQGLWHPQMEGVQPLGPTSFAWVTMYSDHDDLSHQPHLAN